MDQDDYVMLIELFCPLGVYFYHYMDTDDYVTLTELFCPLWVFIFTTTWTQMTTLGFIKLLVFLLVFIFTASQTLLNYFFL